MKNYFLILVSPLFVLQSLKAQIGINTTAPDTSAALHIVAKPYGQGFLMPRLTQAQRIGITMPAKGLMVYDLTDDLYYMNLTQGTNNWYVINPWITSATTGSTSSMYTHSVVTQVGIGTSTPTATLDVIGNIKSSTSVNTQTVNAQSINAQSFVTSNINTNSISVAGFANNALVPTGGIIMWSGSPTGVPSGWTLCDGTNGTPDLRGRFIVGYDINSSAIPIALTGTSTANVTNYGAIGNTGGENGHILTKTEIPPHHHSYSITTYIDDAAGSGNWIGRLNVGADTGEGNIGANGDGTGAAAPHENRPPYYVLAFIMKLP